MKRLFWLGLIANEYFHSVVAGGHAFQRADALGLGGLAELTENEAYSLLAAVALKGIIVGRDGKGTIVDANEGGSLPSDAIPLKTLVWIQEYRPDRASTTRREEPRTIAAEESAAFAEIAAAGAKSAEEAKGQPAPVVIPIPETPAQ